jgi:gamma-glutamyltranspeptidase/glutathione hydrolase
LESLAAGGVDAFYEGDIARACIGQLNGRGARFTPDDWAPSAEWVAPVSAPFAGAMVHTQPPVSQGFVLPLALRIFEGLLDRAEGRFAEPVLQYVAVVRAFEARVRDAGDPTATAFDVGRLFNQTSVDYMVEESLLVQMTPASVGGDTTYVLAVDGEGNAVSLIQSVFAPWGSGVVVSGTGILLNNRMCGFSLRPGHPNEIAPRKRPMHTLHSFIATDSPAELVPLASKLGRTPEPGELQFVGGTPGAHRQVQTNLQILDAVLRNGADLQDALDAPRWSVAGGGPRGPGVEVEARDPDVLGDTFRGAGLAVESFAGWDGRMGRAYLASVGRRRVEAAGDLRGEGQALVI